MQEIWKDINEFEGYYMISSYGRVKSVIRTVKSCDRIGGYRTVNERIMSTRIDKYGYLTVKLNKDGHFKHCTIHRLLAQAFIPNPNNLPSINHKDENKLNSTISNLEWCSVQYNNLYNHRQEKIAIKLRENNKTGKAILQFDACGNIINEFSSLRDLNRKLGVSRTEVRNCCIGNRSSYHGCMWKYK